MARTEKSSSLPLKDAVYIALMRGINVGGRNRLPMKDLALLFEEAGCRHVRTYIQSGNVVFRAPREVSTLAARISKSIAGRYQLRTPIVLLSREELTTVVAGNPFLQRGTPSDQLHAAFLADTPTRAQMAALDAGRSPGDSFEAAGRCVYLHLPNGAAQTRLTNAYLDATLKTTSTLRNWRTVQAIAELARAPA